MEPEELYAKELRKSRLLALAMLVAAPLIYLVVALLVRVPVQLGGEMDMMFYILWTLAVIEPAFGLVIARVQLAMYRSRRNSAMSPAQLFTNLSLIKMAMAEAVYIFGLVVYLVSGDIARMLAFYPVGIIWSLVYWPRRSSLGKFRKEMEAK